MAGLAPGWVISDCTVMSTVPPQASVAVGGITFTSLAQDTIMIDAPFLLYSVYLIVMGCLMIWVACHYFSSIGRV